MSEKCIICENQVTNSQKAAAADKHVASEVDVSKNLQFVVCNICRDEVEIAHRCIKKFRSLITVQSPIDQSQFQDAITQTESSQQSIIIVNQISREVEQRQLEAIFSEYGTILKFYFKKSLFIADNFAQITFSNENEALKVMNAAQNKKLRYRGKLLAVTQISEDSCPIDVLSDPCLAEIFLHIDNVDDKIVIGKVCKRWNQVLTRSWSNITEFSDTSELEEMETVEGLRLVLQSCGRFLKSLKFTIYDLPKARIKLIRKHCKNIENLQLEMSCKARTGKYHQQVLRVFQQCNKLQRIFIDNLDEEFDYNHLDHLPEEMLEIHLLSVGINTKPSIKLSKFQSLEALALCNFDFGEDTLNGIENLVNLRYLSFDESRVHPSNIRKIQNFEELKHLGIANCGVDDGVLSRIAQNNLHLEYLDISDNPEVTDRSFQYIVRLSNLKNLFMKNLSEVRAPDLTEMRELVCLDVEGCSSITEWTLIMLIDRSRKIRHLHASGLATWRLLVNAEESMIQSGRGPRDLYVHIDSSLAKRWEACGRDGKMLEVTVYSPETKVDVDSWDGWYGDVRILI